ncbi:hypothetical protein HanRHA438_Chr09g0414901 [Helianthus annuus]|uniref:Uncharacterized protein n=1 Tax=Helianthus annuus TaxID=4232 RepID=A0A9K3I834_HELAN|nr:uncharacterized protein LOC110876637 [Helianthus annuus]KAF5792168.1 hypothetical protein HanXRQr2_Chr09g0403011 [Helianthus annuus]KAJ0527138.1 hypothetical protein HanHA300_Chr09g0330831 [Helianthus annuus]KAJ0543539.1 hypothetical protein HanHA89_Chr09g0351801 [Helianthus annuus]KAJ0708592.1 hypothetical protein HanLR1_Chr09g0331101 [Helianthus annuus]KAJ0889624.1 hypothetical protein HanRHA438_Chr09g0414901 [Helianthus annuus]
MQLQGETDDLGFCLSFSCYFSDGNSTASAAAKVICELKQEQAPQFYEFSDVDEDEFEFSPDEQVSGKQIDDFGFIFSIENSAVEETDDAASPVSVQLHKSSVNEQESYPSSSFSYSEADENECDSIRSGMFCMWSGFEKCKKSSSTGSHGSSRRWRILNSPGRSKCKGEESSLFLRSKKADASKDRRVAGKPKTASFHEVFYVQKRAEQKGDKMKSFLPYKQDLLGFFVNIKRSGNKK